MRASSRGHSLSGATEANSEIQGWGITSPKNKIVAGTLRRETYRVSSILSNHSRPAFYKVFFTYLHYQMSRMRQMGLNMDIDRGARITIVKNDGHPDEGDGLKRSAAGHCALLKR